MKNPIYVVIMAGGAGTRFWPMSTEDKPKQFLDMMGTGKTLLQHTISRFEGICPVDHILVVTAEKYFSLAKEQCPQVLPENILTEPCRRNTAPCIAYACYKIRQRVPEANIVVAPADHLIIGYEEFKKNIMEGIRFVDRQKVLLTFGVKPHRPDTGYGYIQAEKTFKGAGKVASFKEKPNETTAKAYLVADNFLWNSGIFAWPLTTILEAFELFLPEVSSLFNQGKNLLGTPGEQKFIDKVFPQCPSISIDYGILEKAGNIYVMQVGFDWSDLGTWGSLWEQRPKTQQGNVISNKNIALFDCENCIVEVSGTKKLALQGLQNYIIVEANDTLLICKREEEQRIRYFQAPFLKKGHNHNDYA